MYSRYQPYSYQRRYYNINPYYYGRYYNPYGTNVIDSQVSDVNQSINNFGDMTNVNQDSNVYQLMTPEPEQVEDVVEQCDPPAEPSLLILPQSYS